MTQAGFAGNLRYVALPAALVCVLAGAGWVDLVRDAARRVRPRGAGAAAVALAAAPRCPFVATTVDTSRRPRRRARRSPSSTTARRRSSRRPAARAALLRCGPVYAPPFEVQAVAWAMHVHADEVGIFASAAGHRGRAGTSRRSAATRASAESTKNRRWVVASQLQRADALT